jgi:hypothetical protein
MSTTMQNPEALLSAAAPEEQETPLTPPPPLLHSAATTFEPPYVRIVPRFYAFETVPTRLQDRVSMAAWQSLGRTVRPVLRRNEQLDKCLTWICCLFWATYVVLLIVVPWAVIARNDNWRFALTMGTIVLGLVVYLMVQSMVQEWQQRALETACRSAEQTTFRQLGWALDGCYNGGVVCCRIPSVIYFSPLDIRNENHWYESEHAAKSSPVCIDHDTMDLEDSLARRGFLRIPLVQHGYQWSSISLPHLEAFVTLPMSLQPRQEHLWTTFWSKVRASNERQLMANRWTLVLTSFMVVSIVLMSFLNDMKVLSDSGQHTAFLWVMGATVVGLLYVSTWRPDTKLLVRKHALKLAQQLGLYVECRKAPTNECLRGHGLFFYLYPVPGRVQLPDCQPNGNESSRKTNHDVESHALSDFPVESLL